MEELDYIPPRLRHCIGCRYLSGNGKGGNDCCEYIFIVGKPRPCPPGAECTVKVPKTKLRERRKG